MGFAVSNFKEINFTYAHYRTYFVFYVPLSQLPFKVFRNLLGYMLSTNGLVVIAFY